jgi:hypothetical protein
MTMKKMKHLTPIAGAVACWRPSTPALAFEQIDLGNGLKLDARVNLTYTLATRLNTRIRCSRAAPAATTATTTSTRARSRPTAWAPSSTAS